jgi:hypothetical protein
MACSAKTPEMISTVNISSGIGFLLYEGESIGFAKATETALKKRKLK